MVRVLRRIERRELVAHRQFVTVLLDDALTSLPSSGTGNPGNGPLTELHDEKLAVSWYSDRFLVASHHHHARCSSCCTGSAAEVVEVGVRVGDEDWSVKKSIVSKSLTVWLNHLGASSIGVNSRCRLLRPRGCTSARSRSDARRGAMLGLGDADVGHAVEDPLRLMRVSARASAPRTRVDAVAERDVLPGVGPVDLELVRALESTRMGSPLR